MIASLAEENKPSRLFLLDHFYDHAVGSVSCISLNGPFFVHTSVFSLCACFTVLQSKHLGSHPEASRLVIGPSGF